MSLLRRALVAAPVFVASGWLLVGVVPEVSAQDQTFSWNIEYKAGDVQKFRTYLRITGRQPDDSDDIFITSRSTSRHEYKQVGADGTISYDQVDETSEMAFSGKPVPVKSAPKNVVQITLAKSGQILTRVNPTADPFNSRHERTSILLLSMPVPPKPVKAGESWSTNIPNPFVKNNQVAIQSTLVGKEKVLGQDALRIDMKMQFPTTFGASEKEIVKATTTYYLDAKTFQILKAVHAIKDPMLPLPGNNMEAKVIVNRILPGVNEKADAEGEALIVFKK